MKKIGIFTINGNNNIGNKLQNYALKKFLESKNFNVETIWFYDKKFQILKPTIKRTIFWNDEFRRESIFEKFTQKYLNRKYYNTSNVNEFFEYFVVGSDQVWNYKFKGFNDKYFLNFSKNQTTIAYAASIGLDTIDSEYKEIFKKGLNNIDFISVREDEAKLALNDISLKEIFVLIDPTMLLDANDWDKISLRPKQLKNFKKSKYILNYFLGELSEDRKNEIERVAKENNCEIINILDKNSPFYECGPSEFLWLEKNAFLICTDSFHSSVFAILYNRPFIIFDREQEGMVKMNSRLDTLISKFNLKNRKFEGKITEENLNHDYSEAYKILEVERQKSKDFLERALDIKK